MWVNQDQMFADEKPSKKIQFSEEAKQTAIQELDTLACKIADGEIHVKSIRNGIDQDMRGRIDKPSNRSQKELTVKYTDFAEYPE